MQAHQPDLSSTMLIEREDNTWILQVRAAMTAFEYEVAVQFPERTFEDVDEFKEMLIEHVKANISVRFNEEPEMVLESAFVKLGHESNVLFELKGVPEDFNSLFVQNSSFKDISRNQSGLVVFKEGFAKKQFVLNNANGHSAELKVKENSFVLKSEKAIGTIQSSERSLLVIAVVSIGMLVFFWLKTQKIEN